MKLPALLTLFILATACSNATDYSGQDTSVVITKNPKGQSEDSSTKQLKLAAPWLDDTSQIILSPQSIVAVDKNGIRNVVGEFNTGTLLTISKPKTVLIQFDLPNSSITSTGTIEIQLSEATLKNVTRNLGTLKATTKLKIAFENLATTRLFESFIQPARAVAGGQCELPSTLSSQQNNRGSSINCGSYQDSPIDDNDNDGDDDNDDDDDNNERD